MSHQACFPEGADIPLETVAHSCCKNYNSYVLFACLFGWGQVSGKIKADVFLLHEPGNKKELLEVLQQ